MGKKFVDPNLPPVKKWSTASKVILSLIGAFAIAATLVVILSKNLSL